MIIWGPHLPTGAVGVGIPITNKSEGNDMTGTTRGRLGEIPMAEIGQKVSRSGIPKAGFSTNEAKWTLP
jgi:hypothetical protein